MPPAVKAAKALRCPLVAPPYADFTTGVLAFQLLPQLQGAELEVAMDRMRRQSWVQAAFPTPSSALPLCLPHSGFPQRNHTQKGSELRE